MSGKQRIARKAAAPQRRIEPTAKLYDVEREHYPRRKGVCYDCRHAEGIWRDRCGLSRCFAGTTATGTCTACRLMRCDGSACGPAAALWEARS